MAKKIIAVMGGTGLQGGGVVDALLGRDQFAVRVLTRKPAGDKAKALAARGVEVVPGDLEDPASLEKGFAGAHGVFLVTNFWDPGTGPSETKQGRAGVQAARKAGVDHLIWSTLPNSKQLSGGAHEVLHFTGKALVDADVSAAGFKHHTFVEAPMYFQNLNGMMAPRPAGDGKKKRFVFPMDPARKVIHAGDVTELGQLVARAFEQPDKVGSGQHLALAGDFVSWNEMVRTLNDQGHEIEYERVPAEVFDDFFPGAAELRDMMEYFEQHTYFGPDAKAKIAAARALVPEGFKSFAAWARENMKP